MRRNSSLCSRCVLVSSQVSVEPSAGGAAACRVCEERCSGFQPHSWRYKPFLSHCYFSLPVKNPKEWRSWCFRSSSLPPLKRSRLLKELVSGMVGGGLHILRSPLSNSRARLWFGCFCVRKVTFPPTVGRWRTTVVFNDLLYYRRDGWLSSTEWAKASQSPDRPFWEATGLFWKDEAYNESVIEN